MSRQVTGRDPCLESGHQHLNRSSFSLSHLNESRTNCSRAQKEAEARVLHGRLCPAPSDLITKTFSDNAARPPSACWRVPYAGAALLTDSAVNNSSGKSFRKLPPKPQLLTRAARHILGTSTTSHPQRPRINTSRAQLTSLDLAC